MPNALSTLASGTTIFVIFLYRLAVNKSYISMYETWTRQVKTVVLVQCESEPASASEAHKTMNKQ